MSFTFPLIMSLTLTTLAISASVAPPNGDRIGDIPEHLRRRILEGGVTFQDHDPGDFQNHGPECRSRVRFSHATT